MQFIHGTLNKLRVSMCVLCELFATSQIFLVVSFAGITRKLPLLHFFVMPLVFV